jgi:beta-barrel assembly-enhancing protease
MMIRRYSRNAPGIWKQMLVACVLHLCSFAAHAQDVLAQPSGSSALVADIPPGSLAQALVELSHQTALQFAYLSETVHDQGTRGAPAGLAPREALARLLEGTGLTFEFLNDRTVRIFAAAAPEVLEEVIVVAHLVPPPPHFVPPSAKELRTLEEANEAIEGRIVRNHLLYGQARLDAYVQGVASSLLAGSSDPNAVHVRVIRGTEPNAFALSDGSIYVTTALLVSLADESELATVLGHEVTHYENGHVLRGMRDEHRKTLAARTTGLLLGIAVGLAEQHAGLPADKAVLLPRDTLMIWVRASVAGYSRDLEREADDGGIRRMIAAGYDSGGALAVLQRLAEQASSKDAEIAKYASHPRLTERIANHRALLAGELASTVGAGRQTRRAEYQAEVAGLPLEQVAILLDAGELDRAETAVEAVIATGDSSRAEFLQGEIARNRIPHTDATDAHARAAYERAVALPEPPPAAFRELALLYSRQANPQAARTAFQQYLDRAPHAVDAPLVRRYLEQDAAAAAPPGTEANK